jgi:hypothetical protein
MGEVTCNVTELRHHISWFDELREVFAVDDNGKRYEIYKLLDVDAAPVLKIREVKDGR